LDFNTVTAQFIKPPEKNPWLAELFVLRLDLADPALGGNKWFKLFRWFDIHAKQKTTILSTMGGPWSNHLVAFSEMCFRTGKTPELWVRGEEPEIKNPRLIYLAKHGALINFISRDKYRELREMDAHPLDSTIPFLPEGGRSVEAVSGVKEKMSPLTHGWPLVLCAAGTGTTAAGLITGASAGTQVIVFPALKAVSQIEENIKKLTNNFTPDGVNYKVEQAWPELRFGKITQEIKQFTAEFLKSHDLPLDYVYTARMMMNLMQGPGRKYLNQARRCLFIHSGGLFMPQNST
jgi:1-aminocyclopropane-1-carboxylate deaminase